MTDIKTIILDFDGVVVESNAEKDRAWEAFFALYPAHQEAMRRYHLAHYGSPRGAKFAYYADCLLHRLGDPTVTDTMSRQFADLLGEGVIACPEVPGARAFLQDVRLPVYLSSTTPEGELREILLARDLAKFFTDVFGDPPRTKRDAIAAVLARERLTPRQVLFVGDTPADYKVATEAGLQFVRRDSGVRFDAIECETCRDLREVARLIRPVEAAS